VLDVAWRRQVAAFFAEVFGWADVTYPPGDPSSLILLAHSPRQFVFLLADDTPMRCSRMNHFGLEVSTVAELEDIHRRAVAYREKDAHVDIVPPKQEIVGPFRLTSFHVGYMIPMMVEVQHFEELRPG
jgi:hypothetical protein